MYENPGAGWPPRYRRPWSYSLLTITYANMEHEISNCLNLKVRLWLYPVDDCFKI